MKLVLMSLSQVCLSAAVYLDLSYANPFATIAFYGAAVILVIVSTAFDSGRDA